MLKIIPILLVLALVACHNDKRATPCRLAESGILITKSGVRLQGYTPVKNHGEAQLGWIYGMLATMESEHIARGDSVHLSTAYLIRMVLRERTVDYFRSDGEQALDTDGQTERVPLLLEKYGLVPYDSYPDKKDVNYGVVCRKLVRLCDDALAKHRTLSWLLAQTDQLLDREMGLLPANTVHLYRADYTRREFARSVCAPGEYQKLCLCEDNTPDSLLAFAKRQIAAGHPVCWEGDETTGHHVMPVIGFFLNEGTLFFVCKDAHGKGIGNQGLLALPETYLQKHTLALLYAAE